jgi:SAM-dependent methyltransferase
MTTSIPVDPSNAGQLQAWKGNQGQYWTSNADLFDLCVVSYDGWLLDAATIRPGDHVLDIGCGTGATTRAAARIAVDGEALGVDLSSSMIDLGGKRAARENVRNAVFEQADVQIHPFPERHLTSP